MNALHAEAFDHPVGSEPWATRLERHSLGWVCARECGSLVGFVNVAWDGAVHGFPARHDGRDPPPATAASAGELVRVAAREAVRLGCGWLHVDYEPHLAPFYRDACGFRPTDAGLIDLARPV